MNYSQYAFFDLDNTLISIKSLTTFYRYYLEVEDPKNADKIWLRLLEEHTSMLNRGVKRDNINAWFYNTYFMDVEIKNIVSVAKRWLELAMCDSSFFNQYVIDKVSFHAKNDTGLVIVTGSFREVVKPIAMQLGIDNIICAPLIEKNGFYTGELYGRPTIGDGKLCAVDSFLRERNVSPKDCFGYGDDYTDIPFLEYLGHPVALADGCKKLHAFAKQQNWEILVA